MKIKKIILIVNIILIITLISIIGIKYYNYNNKVVENTDKYIEELDTYIIDEADNDWVAYVNIYNDSYINSLEINRLIYNNYMNNDYMKIQELLKENDYNVSNLREEVVNDINIVVLDYIDKENNFAFVAYYLDNSNKLNEVTLYNRDNSNVLNTNCFIEIMDMFANLKK